MVDEVKIKPITDEDLLALGDKVRGEVVNGEIVIDMAPNKYEHSFFALHVAFFLKTFVTAQNLGRVSGDMAAFKLREESETGIKGARVPDAAYISFERLPDDADLDIFPQIAPNIAVEVISPSDTYSDLLLKVQDYLDAGTGQVWLIVPSLQEVHVYTSSNRERLTLGMDDTLSGGDVLPGFAVPVRAIFEATNSALHIEVIRRLIEG